MAANERKKIEEQAGKVRPDSNYFQVVNKTGLSEPRDLQRNENKITWHTAYAGDEPISHYEIVVGGQLAGKVEHKPQTLKSKPFSFEVGNTDAKVTVVAVDKAGTKTEAILT
jgi:hypothetical protein